MKRIIFVFVLVLLLLCGCVTVQTPEETPEEDVPIVNGWTPDYKPSDFENEEEYYETFLDDFVNHLEPLEFIETRKEYPAVILEIFDWMMDQQPDIVKCEELLTVEVLGDENEFYVTYKYISKEGAEEFRSIRVRKMEEGKYGVLGYGGGAPISHGLEKSDITLEDILSKN